MTASLNPDPTSPGTEGEPELHSFCINPIGGGNIHAEGTDRFTTEAEALAHVNWARATIARLHSDLMAAREERDRARALTRDLHRRTQKAERFRDRWKSWPWMFQKRMLEARRRRRAEDNLIALAKMYGDACARLQALRGIVCDSAKAIGNGACIGPECSLDFMGYLPNEIAGVTSKLRADLKESAMQHLARDVADEQAWTEIAALRERVAKLGAENGKLRHFATFALKWCDRGLPHGGPGNEAQALDFIRHHPTLSAMRRAALSSSDPEKQNG
ncbi:hypothetical protein MKK88_22065 [Methylobacterium sp. E-005]|uniref:hypothetical protein n=1 Tax=Methylobacterium sp. E-005 TaxID=2836549 RepID=UPI001FB90AAA|nr:hypothetical protein [Methylobacterium sp. E-005]MCJ2088642.1 hypothetical protein [Methylobacterium sp. E-005]